MIAVNYQSKGSGEDAYKSTLRQLGSDLIQSVPGCEDVTFLTADFSDPEQPPAGQFRVRAKVRNSSGHYVRTINVLDELLARDYTGAVVMIGEMINRPPQGRPK